MSVNPYKTTFRETYSKIESSFANFVTQHYDLIIKNHQLNCSNSLLKQNMNLTDQSMIHINNTTCIALSFFYILIQLLLITYFYV